MSYKVILADDNPLICKSLKETIDWKKYGCYPAGTAENGTEALKLAFQIKPDILVTDIKMPETDGLELVEKVKKEFPDMEIIMITLPGIRSSNMQNGQSVLAFWILL